MTCDTPHSAPLETFAALRDLPGLTHAFTTRVPGLDVSVDRDAALERLDAHHRAARIALGLEKKQFVFGQQLHGADVAIVCKGDRAPVPGVDGLITADPAVCLGVYVADCCAVYLFDPVRRVIGLLHSGRKGSEAAITRVAIERMTSEFGCEPRQMIAQLSPCVRPPHYEVDFAAEIRRQCNSAGIGIIADDETCTACHPDRYYSYRREKGKTGRMLALLALELSPK